MKPIDKTGENGTGAFQVEGYVAPNKGKVAETVEFFFANTCILFVLASQFCSRVLKFPLTEISYGSH